MFRVHVVVVVVVNCYQAAGRASAGHDFEMKCICELIFCLDIMMFY